MLRIPGIVPRRTPIPPGVSQVAARPVAPDPAANLVAGVTPVLAELAPEGGDPVTKNNKKAAMIRKPASQKISCA